MQKFGKIIKQINRRTNMEHETFECSFKKAFEKDDGQVTVYINKDDGSDMTVYGAHWLPTADRPDAFKD